MDGREELIRKLNNAFADCDTKFLSDNVTDDIQWKIIGEKTISGRKEFEKSLNRMKTGGPMDITVQDIISFKEKSVVEGIVEFMVEPGKKRKYAFCDIYTFSTTNENKIVELRTYIKQIKKYK
ncbi:nuclear transport factor 2 family protein [Christiangramia forsetii]|nr:nuclear transport factor 2 family protein [Christiangramia forsetii]